jgi:hypothetical protein
MQKIVALVESGVVDASSGPRPEVVPDERRGAFVVRGTLVCTERSVDVLAVARVHPFDIQLDASPLYRNLQRRGLVQRWVNRSADGSSFSPGGIAVDHDLHPLTAEGLSDARMTIVGPPSEGARFFQLGALRPDQDHHVMRDVTTWVRSLGLFRELKP